MESLFDTIAGLPVHPLVVHFAVVLLPVAAIGVIASLFSSKIRNKYLGLSVLGILLGTGAAFVAKESGEALAARVGLPVRHSDLGTYLLIASAIFFVVAALWYRQGRKHSLASITTTTTMHPLGILSGLVGISVIGLSVITGHTGAEAVWQGKLNPKSEVAAGSTTGTITMAEVATHNSPTDCWSAIDGKVYNLTQWIDKHPGGAVVIKSLCGKDGSAGFNGQHQGQRKPADELARFFLGDVKSAG